MTQDNKKQNYSIKTKCIIIIEFNNRKEITNKINFFICLDFYKKLLKTKIKHI